MEEILEQIVEKVPPPPDTGDEPLRALIFDSYFDPYRGVVVIFRIMDGNMGVGDQIKLMNTGATFGIEEIGIMRPNKVPVNRLSAGEVVGTTTTHTPQGSHVTFAAFTFPFRASHRQ